MYLAYKYNNNNNHNNNNNKGKLKMTHIDILCVNMTVKYTFDNKRARAVSDSKY